MLGNARLIILALPLAILAAPSQTNAGIKVDPERVHGAAACGHLGHLYAIDHRIQDDLKKGRVFIRCGPVRTVGKGKERVLRIMRRPAHETEVRLDRVSGRLWGLDLPLLPIPQLFPPKGGWPKYAAVEKAVRAQGELDPEARLVDIDLVSDEQTGLHAGQHPYAALRFEHRVEGATVLGDRIAARLDLRSLQIVQLTARPWNQVQAPKRRITKSRARSLARRALRGLVPMDVPCCHPDKEPDADSNKAIGDALAGDETVDEVARKKLKRLMRRARVRCPNLEERRLFVPTKKGHFIETWQFRGVPTCTLAGKTKACKPTEAVFVYVTTRRGKILGMKGQIAPQGRNWKPGLPPSPAPMGSPVLDRRAERIVRGAVAGIEKTAELTETKCPPADLGTRFYRRCWNVMMTAQTVIGRVQGNKVSFRLPRERRH